ncbi:MAG: UDP-glucose 4-epimerase GalE [Sphingomonas sp.]|nr:UDP-glucose 4-epimerase GalE [Sphingomonas sp.]
MVESRDILVTGGAGYIGAHACKALAAAGFRPVAYDNLVYGHVKAVKWGPLERGDVLDRARLNAVLEAYDFAAVMHFAAFAYVGESVADPGKYYRNNVAGTLTLIEALRDHGIGKIVFSSTCATYGVPDHVPIAEDWPQRPINPYGATKLIAEQMISDFGRAHGLRSAVLRYFNAAGADSQGDIGECHEPETHLIPLALEAATGGPALTVFGNDYPTSDGTCVRDYIHVTDLAEAHVAALEKLLAGGESGALNLGTGNGVSVLEVLGSVERTSGRKVPFEFGPRRDGDPPVLVADSARSQRELGWSPRLSEIDQIVRSAWRWHVSEGAKKPAKNCDAP